MVVHGEENLSGILEVLNWGISWEELIPDEEKIPGGTGTGMFYGGLCTLYTCRI